MRGIEAAFFGVTGQTPELRTAKSGKPWASVSVGVETGDVDDLDLWREYEVVSKGCRQLTWSAGRREMAGLVAEQTDEEIAEGQAGDEDLWNLTTESWRVVRECS